AGACLTYQRALAETPDSLAALIGLARSDTTLGKEAEAKRLLDSALAHDPRDPIANGEMGLLEARHGDWSSSLEHLRRAWIQNRSNPEIALELARAYKENGGLSDALQVLQSIAHEMQESAAFHFQLAQIYSLLRRSAEAQRERDAFTGLKTSSQDALRFDNPSTYVQ
ncbi:MAG: tetratricopeptide repeat protein, partial [Bryobacterales bacterium]|nr:tetratricopeptide repeat protein [Bryobacterales bacterium]